MKLLYSLALFSLLALAVKADAVVDLTDDDFDAKVGSYDTALVMFYAPW